MIRQMKTPQVLSIMKCIGADRVYTFRHIHIFDILPSCESMRCNRPDRQSGNLFRDVQNTRRALIPGDRRVFAMILFLLLKRKAHVVSDSIHMKSRHLFFRRYRLYCSEQTVFPPVCSHIDSIV